MHLKCTDLLKITCPHRVILPLLLPMKAAQNFGSLCVLDLLESVPGALQGGWSMPCSNTPRAAPTLAEQGKFQWWPEPPDPSHSNL